LVQLDIEPDPVTTQRVILLVAYIGLLQRTVMMGMGIVLQYFLSIEIVHVPVLLRGYAPLSRQTE
jgi:hypothetical protein